MTTIMDDRYQLLGIYTDGDLRRSIDKGVDVRSSRVVDLMNPKPLLVRDNLLAAEALNIMEERKINVLLVEDEQKQLVGVVKINDILRAGVI